MPFYYRLKVRNGDTSEQVADKKRIAQSLLRLREALHQHIHDAGERPCGDSSTWLRIATWNIREFDSSKYGQRLEESLYYIAEIISTFDIVAVQEVRDDLDAWNQVMRILGRDWSYIATDVTEGRSGNRERMVFVFNTKKVWFRNLVGEVVLPKGDRIQYPYEERLKFKKGMKLELPDGKVLESPESVKTYTYRGQKKLTEEVEIELPKGTKVQLPNGASLVLPAKMPVEVDGDGAVVLPEESSVELNKDHMLKLPTGSIVGESLQFARTPFMVAFQSGWLKLLLCTVHIYYGSDKQGLERRKKEIRQLTEFLGNRAESESDSDADNYFFALGDFNIVGKGHATMAALETNGFTIPDAIKELPGSNVKQDKYYDQIAYWDEDEPNEQSATDVEIGRAGVFDFFDVVFRNGDDDPNNEDAETYKPHMEAQQAKARAANPNASSKPWKYTDWRTYQMSDHLPMWVELKTDFGDEYLEDIAE